jgi:hypothetical protein
MSELTRKEKVDFLTEEMVLFIRKCSYKTDKEINELYDQHFNQVTLEDFEGFKKVCGKYRVKVFSQNDLDDKIPLYIDQIKKELNL